MSKKVYVGQKMGEFRKGQEFEPITRVTMRVDDEHYYTAGDDTGREIDVENPWATQEMVDNALKNLYGFVYKPFEAEDVFIPPDFELGDGINIGGMYSMIARYGINYDGMMTFDISAPGEKEMNHEYPYLDPVQRELKRRVKLEQAYFGAKLSRREGLVIEKIEQEIIKAKVVLNAEKLAFYGPNNEEQLYFDPAAGCFKFCGALNVNDNFIVDKLGNVKMNGGINLKGPVTWGDNIPNKKRYAAGMSGPWHDTMQSGDIYCCDWDYTAEKWGEPYKFVGTDGQNGANGSNADVTRANIVLAMLKALDDDGLYVFDGDDGKQYIGLRASAIKAGALSAIDIEGCTYYSKNRVGELTLSDRDGKYSDFAFKNKNGQHLLTVEDGFAGSASLSIAGQPIIYVNAGKPQLAPGVEVHATFA